MQKSNEKSRRLGKKSIILQDRLKSSWSNETILFELDENAASWS
jgi:hypothetical protein